MTDLVSVLLATRNRAALLSRALASLQHQTLRQLEILVLDDGSTDDTAALLRKLVREDTRIRVFRQERSQGLAAALNHLIEASRGKWLARMDDDDVAYPHRLERQLAYMQAHRLDVCGTWYRRISRFGHSVMQPVTKHTEIIAELLFQPPLLHPSVMMQRALVERFGGYRPNVPHAEDYELWTRLAPHCRFGNVPEVLLDYTLSAQQVSRRYNSDQIASAQKIRAYFLCTLDIAHTREQLDIHVHLRDPVPVAHIEDLEAAESWINHLRDSFSSEATHVFSRQWYLYAVRSAGLGPRAWQRWEASALAANSGLKRRLLLWSLCQSRLRYRSRAYRLLEPFAGD